jgi:holliday junction resolvase Hjr
MPNNKSKGSKAERELFQMFVDNHFRAVRVAGSGTMENADCDLIAGKPGEKYCIEAKSTKKTSKYITKEQMNNFIVFSEIFGLKPVIAVRFNRIGWFFFNPNDLEDSGKNWGINVEKAREKGKRFSQFFCLGGCQNNGLYFDKEIESLYKDDLSKDDEEYI